MRCLPGLVPNMHSRSSAGDWSVFKGRIVDAPVPWELGRVLASEPFRAASAVLDIDTGDGGFLAEVIGWHGARPFMAATEAYAPNVPLAAARLQPLGVQVVASHGAALPFASEQFDLLLNRHGHFPNADTHRVLKGGGRLLTQQVGDRANEQIFDWLGVPRKRKSWDLSTIMTETEQSGFHVEYAGEALRQSLFRDVGTLVYYLKAVPWHVPDFSIERYADKLVALHERVQAGMKLECYFHVFVIGAAKV